MFAEEPPSSSDPTKRLCRRISTVLDGFRRLLLQIGGANIAGADRAAEAAYFVVARGRKACPLAPYALLAPLAEAGACEPLPSSLARRRRACLRARSSRTAARQPG